MLGKTHMVVGTATALCILQPKNLTELVVGTGIAAIGGLISDIDVGTSESHKEADKVITITSIVLILMALADHYLKTGLYAKILANERWLPTLLGGGIFMGTCAIGMKMPHRSFMHSALALLILSTAVSIILPAAMPYFAIAFISHIAIDTLNRKKVRIFYLASWQFKD